MEIWCRSVEQVTQVDSGSTRHLHGFAVGTDGASLVACFWSKSPVVVEYASWKTHRFPRAQTDILRDRRITSKDLRRSNDDLWEIVGNSGLCKSQNTIIAGC